MSRDVPEPIVAVAAISVLLKTEKDFCHRKGSKRTFGHRKGLRYGLFCYKNLCSRTSDIIMILIST